MRPHTTDQVQSMKKFVESQPNAAERKTYSLNGLDVEYTTIHLSDEQKPFDYAVAAFVVPLQHGAPITNLVYEIAVSDDVPEPLQGLWAWHELHDFGVLGHEAPDRCLGTEQEFVNSLQPDSSLYQLHIPCRISFYDGLAVFIKTDLKQKGQDSVYSAADLQGCIDAIAFLQTQIQLSGS